LDVYPDGGLSRLRCYGDVTDDVREALQRRFLSALPDEHRGRLEP
jgi:allantoicase